jgi:hypothetical protein
VINEAKLEEKLMLLLFFLVEECPENATKINVQYVNTYWAQLGIYFKPMRETEVSKTDHELAKE